jgi:hypothetical protein
MALQIKQLVRTASIPIRTAGRYNRYNYADTDAAATIIAAGYFNDARSMLKVNDRIDIMAAWDAVTANGDIVEVKVTAVPATGDITVAVNTEAVGT